jgi:hypothetical protein
VSYIPTPIKSFQQVAIVCSGTSQAAAITMVDVSASLLSYQGHSSQDNSASINQDEFCYGLITGPTVVTVSRAGNGALGGAITWCGLVEEYLKTFIKSQGSGTIAIPDGSTSAIVTIPAVNPLKTRVAFTGLSNANAVNTGRMNALMAAVFLTDAVTITAARAAAAVTATSLVVGYSYLEFK